jgi:hypothetical protein
MATIPASPETARRRSDVKVEFVLVYTLMGYAVRLFYLNTHALYTNGTT